MTQWALGKRHPCWVTSTTVWFRPAPVFFLWTTLPFVGLRTAQRFSPTRQHHHRASGELKASLKHHSCANPESGPFSYFAGPNVSLKKRNPIIAT